MQEFLTMTTGICTICLDSFSKDLKFQEKNKAIVAEMGVSVYLTVSDSTKKLVATHPNISTNPYGKICKSSFISKLKNKLPGSYKEITPYNPPSHSFRSLFFPFPSFARYEGDISAVTGLGDNWWSNFSVAVLCQSIYWQTKSTRGKVNKSAVDQDVDSFNRTMRSKAVAFYTHILAKELPLSPDQSALNEYISVITDPVWIQYHLKQYNDGTWKNMEWCIFHHWVKLSALGASDNQINGVISKISATLPIPPVVSANSWKNYITPWMNPDRVDHIDIDNEARSKELATKVNINPSGGPMTPSLPVRIKEGYSKDFMNGPGKKYRKSSRHGGGSCFTGNTMVLMADGTSRPISTIKCGDTVMSKYGSRTVAFVSKPLRLNRSLYSINGHSFKFTETHPFVNPDHCKKNKIEPYALAVNPHRLATAIPFMAWVGYRDLRVGSYLCGPNRSHVEVSKLEEFPCTTENEKLLTMFDLILQPDDTGYFEYYVGQEGNWFLIASEIPPLFVANPTFPSTTNAILIAVKIAHEKGKGDLKNADKRSSRLKIFTIFTNTHDSRHQWAIPKVSTLDQANTATSTLQWQDLFLEENEYNFVAGQLCEAIIEEHGEELHHSICLGYRRFVNCPQAEVTALSLFDFNYNHLARPIERGVGLQDKLTVHITIDSYNVFIHPIEESTNIFHSHSFNHIVYLDMANLCTDLCEFEIKFDFYAGEKKLFYTIQHIQNRPLQPYHYLKPIVQKCHSKEEIGTFSFDMRVMTKADAQGEQEESKLWTKEKSFAYGAILGKSLGELIGEQYIRSTRCDYQEEY